MQQLGLNELRAIFRDFYVSKGHYAGKSFSLVPEKDKSLLLINSGMAPLKPYFSGAEKPPSKRMTNCQKCIRTGDLENVGKTSRHGTFFEMLGSFSFGDYFKKESLAWGWEFLIDVLKMPEDKLWISVYKDDDEAYNIWANDIGVNRDRIVRLGKEDNFWEIGVGPCGPCSEIYFDRGEKFGCDKPDCKPGCDCDRYIEFWNHVFTQFNRDENGEYTPLDSPNIDTGLGLERLACLMQDTESIFEIDTVNHILQGVVGITGKKYNGGEAQTDVSIRIITDHIRSVTFLIADGVTPTNEGRGYVLRRILRRACRHGRILGMTEVFLYKLAEHVAEINRDEYPEITEKIDYIKKIIKAEEEKFNSTIDQGQYILDEYIEKMNSFKERVLSGETAFRLYDTYGFPLELTREILVEHGMDADEEGFIKELEKQREIARAARKNNDEHAWSEDHSLIDDLPETIFTGYEKTSDRGTILKIIHENEIVDQAYEGQDVSMILDRTPFYAESGGQMSDMGELKLKQRDFSALVKDVQKIGDIYIHKVRVDSGAISVKEETDAHVDISVRNSTARNHTATHLLHKALRIVLGKHVTQSGSRVDSELLRFDFSHYEQLNKEKLAEIEHIVNQEILKFKPVAIKEMSYEDAQKSGATALFDDKYSDNVRVVSIDDFSSELCGGIHVENTGQIGVFKIISESGIASGIRRIEGITGTGLLKPLTKAENILNAIGDMLKADHNVVMNRIGSLLEESKQLQKELTAYKKEAMGASLDDIISDAEDINGVKFIAKRLDGYSVDEMRSLCDSIRQEEKTAVIVLAAEKEKKATFIVAIGDGLLDKGYHAGNMIKKIAAIAGGGGGGKADMATAGAKDLSKIDEALEYAKTLI